MNTNIQEMIDLFKTGTPTMYKFYIGDLMNIATYQWGEKYDKWEEATGYPKDELKRCATLAARFPASFREAVFGSGTKKDNVISFDHFSKVKSLSDEKALYFLRMVRDGTWDNARFEKEVKQSKKKK